MSKVFEHFKDDYANHLAILICINNLISNILFIYLVTGLAYCEHYNTTIIYEKREKQTFT